MDVITQLSTVAQMKIAVLHIQPIFETKRNGSWSNKNGDKCKGIPKMM
jgi:hypothetical protein